MLVGHLIHSRPIRRFSVAFMFGMIIGLVVLGVGNFGKDFEPTFATEQPSGWEMHHSPFQ
jgi:hypothetical protein